LKKRKAISELVPAVTSSKGRPWLNIKRWKVLINNSGFMAATADKNSGRKSRKNFTSTRISRALEKNCRKIGKKKKKLPMVGP